MKKKAAEVKTDIPPEKGASIRLINPKRNIKPAKDSIRSTL